MSIYLYNRGSLFHAYVQMLATEDIKDGVFWNHPVVEGALLGAYVV